jgi:hypothetical protein
VNLLDAATREGDEPFAKMISLCEAWHQRKASFAAVVGWSEKIGVTTTDISKEYDCREVLVDFWKNGQTVPAPLIAEDLVFKLQNKALREISGERPKLALA